MKFGKLKKISNAPVVTRKFWVMFTLLLGGITFSALGVVLTTFNGRHLLNDLQKMEQQRNNLQVEWGQLLLEQSSLVTQGKVEDMAISQLDMEVPSMEHVVVLTSE